MKVSFGKKYGMIGKRWQNSGEKDGILNNRLPLMHHKVYCGTLFISDI
jgi:hypothetical protein